MSGDNLLGVPETRLADEPEVRQALADAGRDTGRLREIAAAHPSSPLAWAMLADAVYRPHDALESYAYARVGYHRGLDALRRAGWKGQGPIPWAHAPNRGVLRSLFALRRAADAIGEVGEVTRLTDFLRGADPAALAELELEGAPTQAIPIISPPTEAIVIRGTD
ncbi:DUF3151 domain-containing protein [Leifsonia sp. Root112D2]|uniref:DUF3151 domain-containing protein n=1 Tax=Leifsonia sp. Root112D2 TaxID=1736426 RepID=UPI0006FF5A58|nr:DUF3151 domain-containing protein [Leifsonia sp. Root112D2]KQV06906.1 hypothetical protein ASC63_05975 [Leifsonia sp. Root112D2]